MKSFVKLSLLICLISIVSCTPKNSALRFRADKEGTQVYLNGVLKGTIPLDLMVSEGNYKIEFRKENEDKSYYYYTEDVFVAANSAKPINVKLKIEYPEEYYWHKAKAGDDISNVDIYLSKYPNGKYAKQAEKAIEDIYWNKAKSSSSANALDTYVSKYQNGRYKNKVDELYENIHFNEIKNAGYFLAGQKLLTKYKIKYPNSTNIVEAEKTVKNLPKIYFKDRRDGKTYKTTTIGSQTWMAANLAYKASSGCWAYGNNSSSVSKYGYLYTWVTAKNVCPSGWHLPSDAEWTKLTNNLGGEKYCAKKMKSISGWQVNGNNESGFNALPGGYRNHYNGLVQYNGLNGYWWSSTPLGSEDAWTRHLLYSGSKVYRDDYIHKHGLSVRCLKD